MNTLLFPSLIFLRYLVLILEETIRFLSRRRRSRLTGAAAILRGRRRDSLASPLARTIPAYATIVFGD